MGKVGKLAVVSMLGLALAACSAGGSGETMAPESTGDAQVQESGAPADDAIKVEQIDYEVKDGVENGYRRVLFGYTNNSDYTVVSVELLMDMPEDVKDEELESAFADLIEQDLYTVEDLHDIKMGCDSTFAVEPGQASGERAATYGMIYATSLEQYELMEPDMLTIQFLHDGEIYEEYYDYKTGSYTLSSDVIDAGQWGESELAEAVPRPEDALVVDVSDRETQFSFEVACMTAEEFEDYVATVGDAGYTVDVAETDVTYYADNEEGTYHVDLMYWDESGRLDAYVSYVEE